MPTTTKNKNFSLWNHFQSKGVTLDNLIINTSSMKVKIIAEFHQKLLTLNYINHIEKLNKLAADEEVNKILAMIQNRIPQYKEQLKNDEELSTISPHGKAAMLYNDIYKIVFCVLRMTAVVHYDINGLSLYPRMEYINDELKKYLPVMKYSDLCIMLNMNYKQYFYEFGDSLDRRLKEMEEKI